MRSSTHNVQLLALGARLIVRQTKGQGTPAPGRSLLHHTAGRDKKSHSRSLAGKGKVGSWGSTLQISLPRTGLDPPPQCATSRLWLLGSWDPPSLGEVLKRAVRPPVGLVGLIRRAGSPWSVLSRRWVRTWSMASKRTAGKRPRLRGSGLPSWLSSKCQDAWSREAGWLSVPCTTSRDLERCRMLSLDRWILGMSVFRTLLLLWRPCGDGLRLVACSRLDDRRIKPWNLAKLGLRLR